MFFMPPSPHQKGLIFLIRMIIKSKCVNECMQVPRLVASTVSFFNCLLFVAPHRPVSQLISIGNQVTAPTLMKHHL